MVIGCAALISLVAGAALMASNRTNENKLRLYRFAATETPPTGALRGWDAISNTEWTGVDADDHLGEIVLLFRVAARGAIGDLEFWRDVAIQVRTAASEVQFVGLCGPDATCDQSIEAHGTLTLLAAMDPMQIHTVSTQSRLGRALVMRKSKVIAALPLNADRQAVASEILNIAQRIAPGTGS